MQGSSAWDFLNPIQQQHQLSDGRIGTIAGAVINNSNSHPYFDPAIASSMPMTMPQHHQLQPLLQQQQQHPPPTGYDPRRRNAIPPPPLAVTPAEVLPRKRKSRFSQAAGNH